MGKKKFLKKINKDNKVHKLKEGTPFWAYILGGNLILLAVIIKYLISVVK